VLACNGSAGDLIKSALFSRAVSETALFLEKTTPEKRGNFKSALFT
jgi:hypothetical protein